MKFLPLRCLFQSLEIPDLRLTVKSLDVKEFGKNVCTSKVSKHAFLVRRLTDEIFHFLDGAIEVEDPEVMPLLERADGSVMVEGLGMALES
ncbi:hypothetical protein NPIL_608121 [Nephila pilipes]|uniref:Uncharacterized protein n=1 Tax=Nephila pilipes TaxID=299642 RepID=A0A8X6PR49_NEPPI|nr:hypothetical protein NPIL_608121 [Nephila pilipes]